MSQVYKYEPDYAVPPGSTLKEVLAEQGLSQTNFAMRTGMTEKTISQIINGMASISVDTAEKFELVLGIPANFWNRRELAYREAITRTEEIKKLEADTAWLKELPVQELVNRKLIEPSKDKSVMVRRLLEFFGVSSVEAWRNVLKNSAVQFRGGEAHLKYPGYVAAWRRIGVVKAQGMNTAPFDATEFKTALASIRTMTTLPARQWLAGMPIACANAGVVVLVIPEIPKASISGAARWITKDKALIQLSLKYRTNDQFWFTFFHEAGHILLHGRQVFVDYGYSTETIEEKEANQFARDMLIPPEQAKRLPFLKTTRQIRKFAESIGIAAGIIVGRMQHDDLLHPSQFVELKNKLEWKN
jgi:HTH-type transcriptional regulator / antitoxin HigA